MSLGNFADVPVMWKPNETHGHAMAEFKKTIEDKYHIKIGDYWDLHKWSIEYITEFWTEIWDLLGVVYSRRFDKVIDSNVPFSEIPKWFEGARLNYAENLLKYRDDKVALILSGEEERESERVTFAEMYEEARLYAAAFRKIGVKRGDVVACLMSNRKEAVFAMEAVISIGAIWTGHLPLFGAQIVLSKFKLVKPKIFVTVDRFLQNGQEINMLPKVKEISEELSSLEKVIIVASKEDSLLKDISGIRNSCFLEEFLELGREKDGTVLPMYFEQVSFSHPVFISYTSGTTGVPKALVHGANSLLSEAIYPYLHTDASRNSTWINVSPVGWISWNFHCNFLFIGSTVSLFEGELYCRNPYSFFDMVEDQKITHIALPTGVLDEFQRRRYVPRDKHSFQSLRVVMAGGGVVRPLLYDYMYENFRKDILFGSVYGATEFMAPMAMPDTSMTIYKGEIPAFCLGCDIQTVDVEGKPIYGEMGEFVIGTPIPNIPLGLWGDEDGSKFREKYFSRYPGKFATSDYAIVNPITKGLIMCGRSDDTMKMQNHRIGCMEIYSVVDAFSEVRDSLCVSQYSSDMAERVVMFLKIRDGYAFSEELVSRIREAIEDELTIHHVPAVILEIKDIPYNGNSKKMEMVVKNIINKRPYNSDYIVNPECLKFFQDIPELQEF